MTYLEWLMEQQMLRKWVAVGKGERVYPYSRAAEAYSTNLPEGK